MKKEKRGDREFIAKLVLKEHEAEPDGDGDISLFVVPLTKGGVDLDDPNEVSAGESMYVHKDDIYKLIPYDEWQRANTNFTPDNIEQFLLEG